MKRVITIIALLGFIGLGNTQAQEFRLIQSFQNEPLVEVLDTIEEETGYQFSYSSTAIPTDMKVNASLNDSTIEGVLKKIFEGTFVQYEVKQKRVILTRAREGQTVRGTVIDSYTQIPIIGATVVIVGSDPLKGDATDAEGNFRIENVPVGRHTLEASYLGYQNEILPGVMVGTGQEVILEIEITESLLQLDEIVVGTSSVSSAPLNDMAQVSGRSFTVEETKRYPVSVGDPLRLVSSFAGVLATDDGGNDIVVRGNSPRGLLWMLEGVEIPSPNHFSSEGASTGAISMFSTQVISRSDFLTSAFPSEFGNATAGVFDIQLRNGNNERRETTIQLGLLGLDFASEGPMNPRNKSSYLFNYRYSTLAMLDGIGLPLMDQGEQNIFQDLSFKVNVPTERAGTFAVFGLGGNSKYTYNFEDTSDEEIYNMGVLGISNKLVLNNSSVLNNTFSWSGTKVTDKYIAPSVYIEGENFTDNTTFTKGYLRWSTELNTRLNARHFVSSGVTGSYLSYNFLSRFEIPQNNPPYNEYDEFNDKGSSGSFQGFTSWKYRPSEKVTLVNGVHILHFFLSQETVVEPRSNIRWQVKPKFAVFGGFGLHSRIESLEYYFANKVLEDGSTVDFNADLGVTKSSHLVFGFETQILSHVHVKSEVYYQNLYNIPVLTDDFEPGNTLYDAFSTINVSDGYVVENLVNGGSGRNYGVEITVERKFTDGYFFMLNGMLYESEYEGRDDITRNTRYNGNFGYNLLAGKEFNVGKGQKENILGFNLKLTHAGNKRYTPIDLEQSIVEGAEILNENAIFDERFPDYFRADIQINYRKNLRGRTVEWRLDVQNVTNHNNVLETFYDVGSSQILTPEERILIPVLSYRIEF